MKKIAQNRILRVPQALFCAAAVIFIACFLFLHFGANRTAVTLEKPADKAALQGFTLRGAAGDTLYNQKFALENGVVRSKFSPENVYISAKPSLRWADTVWEISANVYDTVDKNAHKTDIGNSWQSTCSEFTSMLMLSTTDGRFLKVDTGITYRPTVPMTVATFQYENMFGKSLFGNYSPYSGDAAMSDAAMPPMVAAGAVTLGDDIFVYCDGFENTPPMLYRVTELATQRQIDKLPRTAAVQGEPILSPTQTYGALAAVHTFQADSRIVGMSSVGDSLCIALYENNTFSLYFMQADGKITDIYASGLIISSATEMDSMMRPTVQFAPQQSEDALCFFVMNLERTDVQASTVYGGLRVKDGKVTASCQTKPVVKELSYAQISAYAAALVLREDNHALLGVHPRYTVFETNRSSAYLNDGMDLNVYEADTAAPVTVNRLQCNEQDDRTAARLNLLSRTSTQSERSFVFPDARTLATKNFRF
ncbi:MAG: hypothetical protein RR937_07405 [Ruthenibacterium sp.]